MNTNELNQKIADAKAALESIFKATRRLSPSGYAALKLEISGYEDAVASTLRLYCGEGSELSAISRFEDIQRITARETPETRRLRRIEQLEEELAGLRGADHITDEVLA